MIKKIIKVFLFLLIPQIVNAGWEEISCEGQFKGKELNQIRASKVNISKNLSVQITFRPSQGCGFELKSNAKGRRYNFIDDELTYLPLKSNGVPIGVKSFVSYPKTEKLKLFRDTETGIIKVKQVNGAEIFFSPETGEIDQNKTTDYKVDQTSFNQKTGGLSLNEPKLPMMTFNFQRGYGAKGNIHSRVTINSNGSSCRIPASSIFNFKYTCDNPTLTKRYCDLPKSDFIAKSKERYNELESGKSKRVQSYNKFLGDFVDGVKLKTDDPETMNELLSSTKGCKDMVLVSPSSIENPVVITPIVVPTPAKTVPVAVSNDKLETNSNPKISPPKISNTEVQPKVTRNLAVDEEEVQIEEEEEEQEIQLTMDEDADHRIECLDKLNEYFAQPHKKKELDEYLRIQGKISLHRIAWVSMKASEGNTLNIEGSILGLLQERNPQLHKSFLNKDLKTRNERLLSVMNELKIKSASFSSKKNIPFQIKYSDVKMIELLVETEKKYGRSASTGARDFTSLINNSMKVRLDKKALNTSHFESILNILLKKAKNIEKDLEDFLRVSGCSNESSLASCGSKDKRLDVSNLLTNSNEVIDHFYRNQFDRDNELYNNLKWNAKNKDYWLHVK
jgi:hypothetical protein